MTSAECSQGRDHLVRTQLLGEEAGGTLAVRRRRRGPGGSTRRSATFSASGEEPVRWASSSMSCRWGSYTMKSTRPGSSEVSARQITSISGATLASMSAVPAITRGASGNSASLSLGARAADSGSMVGDAGRVQGALDGRAGRGQDLDVSGVETHRPVHRRQVGEQLDGARAQARRALSGRGTTGPSPRGWRRGAPQRPDRRRHGRSYP